MNRRLTWLFLILLASGVIVFDQSAALAQRPTEPTGWTFIKMSADEKLYFNQGSVETSSSGLVTVWIKAELLASAREGFVSRMIKEMQSRGIPTAGYTGYSHKLNRFEIDCPRKKMRVLSAVDYDLEGRILSQVEMDEGRAAWYSIIPGSIGEYMRQAVCDYSFEKLFEPEAKPSETLPASEKNDDLDRLADLVSKPPDKKVVSLTKPPIPLSEFRPIDDPQDPDIGVDYVVVTALRVNLREAPDITSRILLTVSQGERLVLLKTTVSTSWYNVIHVGTNTEGWVHASTVRISRTLKPKPKMTIEGTVTSGYENPTLEVTNDTKLALMLKIGDIHYAFYPGESKTLKLRPGMCSFFASAPGVIPDFGEQEFQMGYEYSWRFYIVTTYR